MRDDNGKELGPGDEIDFTATLDESVDIPLEEDTILTEGEYIVYVPAGQRAVVRYEVSAT